MAKLTASERKALPKKVFGLPEKAPGSGSYPMENKAHAQAALSRASNASPADQKRIRAKAHRMYPSMSPASSGGRMRSLASMAC